MWTFQGFPLHSIPAGAHGFLYRISNKLTGRSYIGKKSFWSTRSIRKRGEKKATKSTVESSWRRYQGSCDELTADIEVYGVDAFTFEILLICDSEKELAYEEVRQQFQADVLTATLPDGSPAFYNANINGKWFRGVSTAA